MATSGPKATPEGGLVCLKCQQPTLLKDSIASGRNALRRNCLEWVSADKWLTRCCRKPKPTEVENDDQKERREKAEQLKTSISKMSSAEKAAWYVKQKEERRKQEKTSKRSFNSGVGFAQESLTTSLGNTEKDLFETCEDWCLRQVQLKKFDTLEAAQAGFKQECQKPGARTTQRRGETLLQRFAGVEVDQSHRRNLDTGVRQRADIHDQDDLKAFQGEAEERMARAQWRLDSDKQAMLEGTLKTPTQLLNIEADIERAKQQEQEMESLWMEQLESEAKNKQSATPKPVERSAGVEAMSFQACIAKTEQCMQEVVSRQQALLLGCAEEWPALDTELLRNEAQAFEADCNSCVPLIHEAIQALIQKWSKVKQEHEAQQDGQKLHEGQLQVSKDFKEWTTKCTPLCDLKTKIKSFRQWLNKSKSQAKKADKAAAQAKAAVQSTKLGQVSSWNDATLCKQAANAASEASFAADFTQVGVAWNLQTDLLGVKADQEVRPVVFSSAQGKPFADDMLGHEYFKFQKVWVQEQMKKAAGAVWMSALVTKATVSKKLALTWNKLLGQDTEHFLKNLGNAGLGETFQPQFYQQVAKSCHLHLHGDFGLPEVRLSLESTAFLMGAPLAKLQGDTLKEKRDSLLKLTFEGWNNLATWKVTLSPGKVVVIPGDHVFCSMCAGGTEEVHHGARIHLLSGEHAKRTLQTCKMLVTDNALLGQMKTGALAQALDRFFRRKSQPQRLQVKKQQAQRTVQPKGREKMRSRPLLLFGQRPKPRNLKLKL